MTKIEEIWKAINILFPRHRMGEGWHQLYKGTDAYCTDAGPSGHGNFGCKRCNAIIRQLDKTAKRNKGSENFLLLITSFMVYNAVVILRYIL